MNKLVAFGCSLTLGEALENPEDSWPAVLAKLENLQLDNCGVSGFSNKQIYHYALKYPDYQPGDLVVISWTHIHRHTKIENYAEIERKDLNPTYLPGEIINRTWRDRIRNALGKVSENDIKTFYFEHVHNHEEEVINLYSYMNHLQLYLQTLGCRVIQLVQVPDSNWDRTELPANNWNQVNVPGIYLSMMRKNYGKALDNWHPNGECYRDYAKTIHKWSKIMANVKHVTNCRSCGSELSKTVFDMGELKINAFMPGAHTDIGSAPLTLMHCEECDLIQLSHTVREEDLYKNYWYLSSLNKKIVDNLKSIVQDVSAEVKLKQDDIVLDIGANDGTLLSFYNKKMVTRVGCDPAENIHKQLKKKCDIMIGDFFNLTNWRKTVGRRKAKIVTTVAMFYDLDDPNSFVSDVKQILRKDGVWLCQLMTAKPMLDSNDLGNVIHEHIEYYTYKSLVNLMERHGLEIFDVRENDINGGSYQLYIRHRKTGSIEYPENINSEVIDQWAANIEHNRDVTKEFMARETYAGKKIYIMGASTKGNTIMQYYGLDEEWITGAAEIHPDKIGKYLVGTSIPIVHEDDAKADADYFLVFPFHFKELFVNKIMKDWIDQGGKLIFCTPEFEVVGK